MVILSLSVIVKIKELNMTGRLSLFRASQLVLVVKNPSANAGDPRDMSLIPGSGRSPGEGIGYSLQYSWVSLVAQMVKNLPAIWETWVQSLGWKIPWRKAWQPTPVFFLPAESPWTEEPGGLQSIGLQRVRHD